MNTERFVLADEVWEKVSPHLPGKATDCGVTAADNRLFLEAVLWRVRAGSPWRDLPVAFGNWNSVFQRFRRWAKKGVFKRLFEVLSEEPDFEYALIDGTIVGVHQKASGDEGIFQIILVLAAVQVVFEIARDLAGLASLWSPGQHGTQIYSGLIGNPNSFALLLNLAIAISLIRLLSSYKRHSITGWLALIGFPMSLIDDLRPRPAPA